jgi:hypothetical protein
MRPLRTNLAQLGLSSFGQGVEDPVCVARDLIDGPANGEGEQEAKLALEALAEYALLLRLSRALFFLAREVL